MTIRDIELSDVPALFAVRVATDENLGHNFNRDGGDGRDG